MSKGNIKRFETIHRDTSKLIRIFREIVGGRPKEPHVRFAFELSARSQPKPNLPGGPSHKLFNNYYCQRDGRSLVASPSLVCGPDEVKQLTAGTEQASKVTQLVRGAEVGVRPGNVYQVELKPITEPVEVDDVFK